MGSTDIFSDEWIEKEDNIKLCDILLSWLLDEAEVDMMTDRNDDSLIEFTPLPNIESLSQTIKPCLQGLDDLPSDFTKLFDLRLQNFDTIQIPTAIQLYKTLNLVHQPLTLIHPQFEAPLPKMMPATFPPAMKELPAPALDLFDLDDIFAPCEARLAQLTNKCSSTEDDLEYFISEGGNILNVVSSLQTGKKSAKHILFHIFSEIVEFKKTDYGKSEMALNINNLPDQNDYFNHENRFGSTNSSDEVQKVEMRQTSPTKISKVELTPIKNTDITLAERKLMTESKVSEDVFE